MKLIRTTLRLDPTTKDAAERVAQEKGQTLQYVFNEALRTYVESISKEKAKKIVFHTHDFGTSLDTITREDYYDDP